MVSESAGLVCESAVVVSESAVLSFRIMAGLGIMAVSDSAVLITDSVVLVTDFSADHLLCVHRRRTSRSCRQGLRGQAGPGSLEGPTHANA